MNAVVKPDKHSEKRQGSFGRWIGAFTDALILVLVLLFSALAIAVIALGAPLVLCVSAIAGAFATKRARGRWREAHAG